MAQVQVDESVLARARELRDDMQRFLNEYRFGMREIETKLEILRDDFEHQHSHNPIEHLSSRVKSVDSMIEKVQRKGVEPTLDAIRAEILDVAGVRVTCSFVSDAYRLFELLCGQDDVRVMTVKDYIAHPKENGYKSLHAVVEVPVFLPRGTVHVPVEVQFRTIAMDFWASLEHKIYYKYDKQVPAGLLDDLRAAALTASELDAKMERLHREVHGSEEPATPAPAPREIPGRGAHAA
ncbi:GTP pyrophosphokinase family protein [Microbacterium sp. ZXX196]|uniref:GTP pyrophosphokinase n=1 Tax=Microbacterium sp. ZXX196 TaxID=2609291 RepID=UPI0012B8417E|nr:GTP pyrophosphokinase family protein [Microbacterium sp. ZXX196]MTE24297.1 GTP pyrophosphokinase family protein [Microbacterium sp. ZXX196]